MQYGTKGEGRDGATGGLPNGGEGGQAAEAAAETTSAERDSRTLDYLITVIGFGLCRAWIVFCLGAPLIAGAASSFTWAYLLFGALSALTVSFVANRSGKREGVVRVALFRATPVALAASGIIIPVALALNSEALMIVGFVAGGLGAGPLQVLWGDRFARHATLFAAVASPAAAIVTALVNDIINPLISLIIGGLDFSGLNIGVFPIGDLIMSIINFLCISLVVFWMVKIINRFNRKKEKEPEPEAPVKPTTDELLADILTELKLQNGRAEAAKTLDAAEEEESSASER